MEPDPHAPAIELDELLQHRRFLQALVRRILADEQGVEDVLQETWLKALERPPGPLGPLRAWLARVARNNALNRLRGERRGTDRERLAARPDRVETTGLDTAQKLERQQAVLSAVLRLEEPRRTTVHLRYFEDREPAEIARQMGVSVNTVNDRLRHGRVELRRELARELGVDESKPGALGLVLLPLANLSEGATAALGAQLAATAAAGAIAPTTISPLILGGLLVSKKVLITAGVALLATGLWWTNGGLRPASVEDVARSRQATNLEAPEPTVEAEGPVAMAAATSEAPETPDVKRTAAFAPTTIDGIVLDRDNAPQAGVGLSARLWFGDEAEGEPDHATTLTANSEGTFQWAPDLWRDTSPETFVVQVLTADERFTGYDTRAKFVPGQDPPHLEVRIFALDLSLHGFVLDAGGRPLAGATVRASRSTTTVEDGSYELRVSSQRPGMVHASAPGFAGKREVLVFSGVPSARLDFELRQEFLIFGRVTDERGRPVEGVSLTTFFTQGERNVAMSAADGSYELGGLDPGRESHSLYARRAGFVEASAQVSASPELRVEQDLVMRVGTRVEGRVVDGEGQPLAGAQLYIGFSPNAYDRLDAVAEDDGTFVFPNVKSGEQTIGTHRDGFAPDVRKFEIEEGQHEFDGLVIALAAGRTVEGHVFDGGSRPIGDVLVSVRYQGDWIETRARTDAAGHFQLENLPLTECELRFYKKGWVRLGEALTDGKQEPLEVLLQRAGKLAGRVVDGYTGQPIPAFTIRLLQADCADGPKRRPSLAATWVREGHSFSSETGDWEADDNFEPGTYLGVEATAPGYGAGIDPCVLVETDPDRMAHVIELFPGRRIEGVVRDRVTGQPLAGAVVKRSRTSIMNPSEPHDVQLAHTDSNGAFVLEDVPPGTATLLIEHAKWERVFRDGPFEVAATGRAPYREIEIGGGASLTGIVMDESGDHVPNALVEIRGEVREMVGDYEASTRTDADGRFAFHDLPKAVYTVERARGEGLVSGFRMVVVFRTGASQDIVLGPVRGSASFSGTLVSAEPLPDLPVWVMRWPDSFPDVTEPIPGWGAVARNGGFEFEGLPAGSYKLTVEHRGAAPDASYFTQAEIELTTGENSHCTVPIEVRR